MKFGIIGYGRIAKRHVFAIKAIGGNLTKIHDSFLEGFDSLDDHFFDNVDWVVICSPTNCHYDHVKLALAHGKQVICEKPYVLPWEPVIDSDQVHVVLQTRWLDLPKKAELIRIKAVRDDAYFESWKGNPILTGGMFFDLFIHYIDMARRYNCGLAAEVVKEGKQERWIDDFDLMNVDMDGAYEQMYRDVIFHGKSVKPYRIAELHWMLGRYTERFGFGIELIGKKIRISPNGLVQGL